MHACKYTCKQLYIYTIITQAFADLFSSHVVFTTTESVTAGTPNSAEVGLTEKKANTRIDRGRKLCGEGYKGRE